MSTIETDDRDPFSQGGWNGESATDGGPNRAGDRTPTAIGMDAQAGVVPAADPPDRSIIAMPDGSLATPTAAANAARDPILNYPARLAELDALAKDGDDDASDDFCELQCELAGMTATTLAGLRAHLVQFARWVSSSDGSGDVVAENALAIERGLADGVTRRSLIDLQDRMVLISRLVPGLSDNRSRGWFDNLIKAFANLVEGSFKPRPSLRELHRRWAALKDETAALASEIDEALDPGEERWPVTMTEEECWAIPDQLEAVLAQLKRVDLTLPLTERDRETYLKVGRAEKKLAEMRADPERFTAAAAAAQAAFEARKAQWEAKVAQCGLASTVARLTAAEAETEAVLDAIYETPAITGADFAALMDVCILEEDEVSAEDLDIEDDDPEKSHPFRLKLFRELMHAAPGFEFYSLRSYVKKERYQQLFGSESAAEPTGAEAGEAADDNGTEAVRTPEGGDREAIDVERRRQIPLHGLDLDPGEEEELVELFKEWLIAEQRSLRADTRLREFEDLQDRASELIQEFALKPSRGLLGLSLKAFAFAALDTLAIGGVTVDPGIHSRPWYEPRKGVDSALVYGMALDVARLVPALAPLIAAPVEEDAA